MVGQYWNLRHHQSKESLKLTKSCLTSRFQRTKLYTDFSKRTDVFLRVPQEFVLELLFLNIYIKDLFFLAENTIVCNYADDTTFYECDSDLHSLVLRLEHDYISTNELNQNKCHLLILGHKYERACENLDFCKIWESND